MDNKRFFLSTIARPSSAVITFYINKFGNFSPVVATTDMSVVTWQVGDTVPQTSNTPVFTGLTGELVLVRMLLSADDSILSIDLADSGVYGDVLLTDNTLLEYIDLKGNPDLIKLVVNSQSAVGVYVDVSSSGIQVFENIGLMSGFIANNTQLTSISNLVTGSASGPINFQDVTTINTVDLSNFVVSGILNLKNSAVTSIGSLVTDGGTIYDLYNSGLTTSLPSLRVLDLFDARGTELTSLRITSINSGAVINFHDRNLTSSQVNKILAAVDASGLTSGTIDLAGNNAYVSNSAGGYNGFALVSSIIGKSNSVLINYGVVNLTAGSAGSHTLNVTTEDSSTVDILVNGIVKSSGVGNRTFTAAIGDTIAIRPQNPSMFRTFSNIAGSISGVADFSYFNMTSIVFTSCPSLSNVKMSYGLTRATLYLTLNNTGVGFIDLSGIVPTNSLVVDLTSCTSLESITTTVPTDLTVVDCPLLDEIDVVTNTVLSITACKASALSLVGSAPLAIDIQDTNLSYLDLKNITTCTALEITGSPYLASVTDLPAGTYNVDLSNSPLLNSLTLPADATINSLLNLQECGLVGLTIAGSIMTGSDIRLNDNLLSTTNVNLFLDELNNAGLSGCHIYIGGNNAAPDNSSGGVDGIAVINQLIADGNTVDYVHPVSVMTLTTVKQGTVQIIFDSPSAGVSWSTSNGYSGTGNISFPNTIANTQITVTFVDPTLVSKFVAISQGLSDIVDLSRLTKLSIINLSNNPYISSVIGMSSTSITSIDVSNTNIASLDLTQILFESGALLTVVDAPSLTSVQVSSQDRSINVIIDNTGLVDVDFNNLRVFSVVIKNSPITTISGLKGDSVTVEIVGTLVTLLDVSGILDLALTRITDNPNLTTIVGLSGTATDLFLNNNNITGILDLSTVIINNRISLANNPLLTQVVTLNAPDCRELILDGCSSLINCDLTDAYFAGSDIEPAILTTKNCTSLIDLGEVVGVMCNINITNTALTSINVSDITIHSSFVADDTGLTLLPDLAIDAASTATVRTLSIQDASLSGIIVVPSRFTEIYLNDNVGITQLDLDIASISPTYVDVSGTALTTLDHSTNKILGTFDFRNTSISTIRGVGGNGGYTMLFGNSVNTIAAMNNVVQQLSLITVEPSILDFTGAVGALDSTSGGKNGIVAYNTLKSIGCTIIEAGPSYKFTILGNDTISPTISYTSPDSSSKWVVGSTTYYGNSPTIPVLTGDIVRLISYDHLEVHTLNLQACLIDGVLDVNEMVISNSVHVTGNTNLTRLLMGSSVPVDIYAENTAIDELLEAYNVNSILYLGGSTVLADCNPTLTTTGPISYIVTDSLIQSIDIRNNNVNYLDVSRNPNLTDIYTSDINNTEPLTLIIQGCETMEVFNSTANISYIDISQSLLLGPGVTLPSTPRSIKAVNSGLTGAFSGFGGLSQMIIDRGILDVSNNAITTLDLSYQSTAALELLAPYNGMTNLLVPVLASGLKIFNGIGISNNLLTTLGTISSTTPIYIKINDNSINGVVDLSQVVAVRYYLHLYNQTGITALTLPTSIYSGTDIDISSALGTAALVNKFLVDLVLRSIVACTINIGGTNPVPDTTSGGYNGSAAKTTLELTNTFV